ncbi:ABC transporter substrate-binding protein [Rhodococcus opacus]|uniref:ABC transporter substrate-binding protein n=1 Tax=Rhodococcus opacus TaxID=37919 RepID=UPI00100988E1|nr:hypothetical protein [Rhodococcus opacus]
MSLLAAVACSGHDPTTDELPEGDGYLETVTVTMSSKLETFAPVLLGDAMGEYERENIRIKYAIARPSDGLVTLSTGKSDVQLTGPTASFFNAVAGGSDIKAVAAGASGNSQSQQGIWVRKDLLGGRAFDASVLEGERVSSAIGTGAQISLVINDELEQVGLDINSIEFQQTGSADILLALQSGATNAGWLVDPFWQEAEASGCCVFGFGVPEDQPGSVVLFGPRLLNEDRELGERFLRAYHRTIENHLLGEYHQNANVMDVVSETTGTPLDVLSKSPSLKFPQSLEISGEYMRDLQEVYARTPNVLGYKHTLSDGEVLDTTLSGAAK